MEKADKILAIITAFVIVASLTLVGLGMMSWKLFWIIAILAAITAYYWIPMMRKKRA